MSVCLEVYLRSGQVVEVKVDDFEITSHLAKPYSWHVDHINGGQGEKLLYLDPAEIVAVVSRPIK